MSLENQLQEENFKRLELAMAKLDREFGPNSVIRLGNENVSAWPATTSGAAILDEALGRGFPKGRVVEIYGPESSGKSTISMSVVAAAQAAGEICAYIDTEHAVDPVYAKALGVDMDNLIFSQPSTAEMTLDIAIALIETGTIGVLVIDSVAMMTPKAELEGDMDDQQMGLLARIMAKGLRKLTHQASKHGTLVIFVNQLREKIGVMFGNPETTPGGKALRFAASVRLDLRKKEDIKNKDGEVIGVKVKAKTVKNKMSPPLKVVEFDIIYGKGVDNIGCVVDMAVEKGILQRSGAWYSYNGTNVGQGRPNTIEAMASDMDMFREIEAKVREHV